MHEKFYMSFSRFSRRRWNRVISQITHVSPIYVIKKTEFPCYLDTKLTVISSLVVPDHLAICCSSSYGRLSQQLIGWIHDVDHPAPNFD